MSIPFRYEETAYEFSSVEPKYVYTDVCSGYTFNQAPLPKPCLHTFPIDFGPFSDIYSSCTGVTTDGYYLADHQIIQEQYASGYAYDTAATTYMAKYHAMEYEFNTGLPNNPGFLPNFATEYSSSNCGTDAPSYPQTAWSPSEPSVASLSPPYDTQWEEKDFAAGFEYPLGNGTDEVLQGLGLYDCPELATDHESLEEPYASYPSSGRGLKLEESFEFKEEYSDDEDEEDEEDEEECDED